MTSTEMATLYGDQVTLAGLVFNTKSATSKALMVVDSINGWDETPELQYTATNRPNRDGADWVESSDIFKARGLVVEGAIVADNRSDYLAARQTLVSALTSRREYELARSEVPAKRLLVHLAGQITWPIEMEVGCRFSVPLLAPDPFKESVGPQLVNLPIKSPVVWGRTFPEVYPRAYAAVASTYRQVVDTNWVSDPSFELANTTWTRTSAGGSFTITAIAGGDRSRVAVLGWTAVNTPTRITTPRFALYGLQNNDQVNLSVAIRNGTATGATVKAVVSWFDSNNVELATTPTELTGRTVTGITTAAFTRASVTTTKPTGATQASVALTAESPVTASGNVQVDAVMLNRAGGTYFDGSVANAYWTGASEYGPSSKYINVVIDPASESAQFVNVGNQKSYPLSTVIGPLPRGWRLVNDTTGEYLLIDIALGEGRVLTIDHNLHTAVFENGEHVENLYAGTWFGLAVGVNDIKLQADPYNAQARWMLTPRSRWA